MTIKWKYFPNYITKLKILLAVNANILVGHFPLGRKPIFNRNSISIIHPVDEVKQHKNQRDHENGNFLNFGVGMGKGHHTVCSINIYLLFFVILLNLISTKSF